MGKVERQKKTAAGIARKSRAGTLTRGVNRLGRARSARASGRFRHFAKGAAGRRSNAQAEVKLEKVAAAGPEPRWYACDDVPRPLASSRRKAPKPTKLRKSISPGTVLILLAGRHQGKRVVFLKQLSGSGLLLVSGPFALNGVPLRRVNQAYVISTSTKINVSGVDVSKVNDAYFSRTADADAKVGATDAKDAKKTGDSKTFFDDSKEQKTRAVSDRRKAEQSRVDGALIPLITAEPELKRYLKSRFTLTKHLLPHQLAF